jgi:hypothetical protein
MAGKTFPGIGDLEDESPPLDPADAADSSSSSNSQSHYSGPTVVDEAKVEQGLKKLRSLDAPPGPLTGIHQAIADVLDDPTRVAPPIPVAPGLLMPEITIDPARGTAVGRSVSGPVVGQQTTQPFDDRALRGTMFGHGVHLPDLDEARRAQLLETSKALAVVERGVPTTNEITVFQPGTYPQRAELPLEDAPPFPRPPRFHAEDTPIELRTVLPRKQLIIRVAAAGAGIVAIVVAALLWVRSTDEAYLGSRSAATTPAPTTRPIEARPVVAPLPTPPAPQPAAIAPPPPATPPAPEARAPARKGAATPPTDDDSAAAAPVEAKPARRPHAVSTHSDRRHSPSEGAEKLNPGAKPDRAEAPTRPTRGKRPVEEDPDATMAPSIE